MTAVYAYKNTNEEVMRSSSGGAFIALCHAFERLHGGDGVAFYGAAFDENMRVVHRRAASAKECAAFQGSKYVRSDAAQAYDDAARDLQNGLYVLFSGVPCQLAALKKRLEKAGVPTQRLLTVDIICHGTPRPVLWDAYRAWLEGKAGGAMTAYSFRYKPAGWKAYPAYAAFANGRCMIDTAETSVYAQLHLRGYSMSKGCFTCPYATQKRLGDITLGDYWGVEKAVSSVPAKTGVSLVLTHTAQGEELASALRGEGVYLEKTQDTSYLSHQQNLNRPTEKPAGYEAFWKDFQGMQFETLLSKYVGYNGSYRMKYAVKKLVRKTPVIEWYRSRKRGA